MLIFIYVGTPQLHPALFVITIILIILITVLFIRCMTVLYRLYRSPVLSFSFFSCCSSNSNDYAILYRQSINELLPSTKVVVLTLCDDVTQ